MPLLPQSQPGQTQQAGQPGQPGQPQQQAGSGFTNLQQYLGANTNNRLGSTVAGGIQQAGQQASGAIQQAGQQFQQGASQEKARLGQLGQDVTNTLGNIPGATDKDVSEFQGVLGAQSLGPSGVQNADQLRQKAQNAQQLGQAGSTQQGRYGLLQRFVGGGRPYSMGQQNLDQLLLGQQGGQQLAGARASTVGLGQQANQQIGAAAAQGQELQGQARQLAESTKGQLGQQITGYDTAMKAQLAQQQGVNQSVLDQLKGTGTNAAINLDPNALKQLSDVSGGTLGAGSQLYNADVSPFLSLNSLYATPQAAQSASDLAKAQMLGKLSGNALAGTDSATTLQSYLANPATAGQYQANNPFAVSSQSDLNAAIQKAKSDYESARGAVGGQITGEESQLLGQGAAAGQGANYGNLMASYGQSEAIKAAVADPNSSVYGMDPAAAKQRLEGSSNVDTSALQQYLPTWAKSDGLQNLNSFSALGAQPNDPGNANYLNNILSGNPARTMGGWMGNDFSPQVQAAMSSGNPYASGIQSMLGQIGQQQNQYNTVIPGQFNVLRTLQANQPAPAVTNA